jgi:hypothetical protein
MPAQVVSTLVGRTTSSLLSFRNPFRSSLIVTVQLVDETGAFQLLTRRRARYTVAPFELQQITYTFTPELIENHSARLLVQTQQGLTWTYPLTGIPEGTIAVPGKNWRSAARSRLDDTFSLTLSGLRQGAIEEEFEHHLDLKDPELEKLVSKALTITLLNPIVRDANVPLDFTVTFEPLRPVAFAADLVIIKKTGGRWKYPLTFTATEPQIDDIIRIEAGINRTSSVAFRITNQFELYADYKAYFSPESPDVFNVNPKFGVLEPLGSQVGGTEFVVSFTPKEYGKTMVGRLVIETEEMQWSYEVRGSHPRYVPPNAKSVVRTRRTVAKRSDSSRGR